MPAEESPNRVRNAASYLEIAASKSPLLAAATPSFQSFVPRWKLIAQYIANDMLAVATRTPRVAILQAIFAVLVTFDRNSKNQEAIFPLRHKK
jgi:hypothetical protein